uniref:THO complex subunit 2-like n=1 Tax=Ciona intestinalis TaxID=7719 RepID=UPI000180BB5D|nr:THO complex subunit 2-like [Ciona intestinalis]|eukprot:XP_002128581.1 THO complex subunit 2-like [Ciona intestinalis]
MALGNPQIVKLEICKAWEKTGKNEVIALCKKSMDKPTKRTLKNDIPDIRRVLYECIHHVIAGKLKHDHLISVISELKPTHNAICSTVVDVLSMIDIELVALDEKKLREKFLSLVATLKDEVGIALLKERLDVETLESLKLINSTKLFQQKYIKTKTRLFYKQQKFNLLREEMEGYSKLSVELGDLSGQRVSPADLLQNIKSLIGCFNIDPNRVLDLILESFECYPEFARQMFIPLVNNYLILCENSTLCHLLGFKFAHYQTSGSQTPESLYNVAALLIQHNLVCLDDLLPHLLPSDAMITEEWTKYVETSTEEARRTTVMLLNPAEKPDEKDTKHKKVKQNNQKFGLCEALLKIGDWSHAEELMDRFDHVQMVAQPPIAKALCHLASYIIDPLYINVAEIKGNKCTPTSFEPHHSPPSPVSDFTHLTHGVFSLLYRLGPKAATDPILLVKLARIGKAFFTQYYAANPTDQHKATTIYGGFLGLISNVLLPSLSLLLSNSAASEEIWMMIKLLPYQTRYRLYGEWKNEAYEKHPELLLAKAQIIDKTKYIMRRLTKENVKQTGRQMGKLSHSSPTILFDCILSQIQRYDNLIMPVVDALKYLTNLTYDVLAFCIIEALANPQKERMKHDDTNISNWLQSLASFCGAIFKKYTIELSGLLQYVANQLKAGKSLDLLIMKEVVQKMSGIEISEEITTDQLEALAGGEILKAEGGYFGQIRNTKKSSNRLKEALLEQNLALPLCLLMAQQRQGIVFHEGEDIHLKLVGKLTDQCHDTLVQFGNFLSIQLGSEEYLKRFPAIDVLSSHFHTPADVAFFLSRPMYYHQINTKYDELRKQEKSKQKGVSDKAQRYISASNAVVTPISSLVHSMHSDKIWLDISPRFYTTFWSLTLYDIEVPSSAYDREIMKLKQTIQGIEQEGSSDSRKRREKERCENLISKLKEEQKKQEDHHGRVRERFRCEKEQWFLAKTTKNDTITKFLQLCIFPRSIFSPLDAVYCAKFVHMLHEHKTPNFSTLLCFDRVFSDISYTVASLTENEASRYGRFLCTMLGIVKKWHASKGNYEKECGDFPGFVTVLRATAAEGTSKANQLDYENFRHVCHKWQYKLTKALVVCLESKEYTQIRNALIILTKILPHFPAVNSLAGALEKRIDKIRTEEKEKRPDLFALAMGYSGMLKMRKPSLIPEHQFHKKPQPVASKTTDKSKERGKSKEKPSKRKTEEKKEKMAEAKSDSNRGKSKDKVIAAGESKSRGSSKERSSLDSSSRHQSLTKMNEKRSSSTPKSVPERDTKRRKLDANHAKEQRIESKEKPDKAKTVEREEGEVNGVNDDPEPKRSRKSKDRKRELVTSPSAGDHVKRHKTESVDRRSKEKEKVRKHESSKIKRESVGDGKKERSSKEVGSRKK